MNLISCKTPNDVAAQTLIELRRIAGASGAPLSIFVPTGATPKPIYKAMVAEGAYWSERLHPIQIDEFISPEKLFYAQLKAELIGPLQLEEKARLIDPGWTEGQMFSHIEAIMNSRIDCALLGLGPNGHVGFHEPGYPMAFAGGRLKVSEQSRTRVVGAHTSEVYTFGVQAFMQAREIIMVVIGEAKREILARVLGHRAGSVMSESNDEAELPATYLKNHPRLTVISDVLNS